MKEYSHYYKAVPYSHIDVYRVLELFNVTDPCIQHAIKKLLVAGGRGHKGLEKDVKEAIISLNRRIEMWEEELIDSSIDTFDRISSNHFSARDDGNLQDTGHIQSDSEK